MHYNVVIWPQVVPLAADLKQRLTGKSAAPQRGRNWERVAAGSKTPLAKTAEDRCVIDSSGNRQDLFTRGRVERECSCTSCSL